jgi:hypothetical protein
VSQTLRVGDRVENLAFQRPDGTPARLSDFAGPLVLVFLRHLY